MQRLCQVIRRRLLVASLLLLMSSASTLAVAEESLCARIWPAGEPFTTVPHRDDIAQGGGEGFGYVLLDQRGLPFRPKSLEESTCALERMFKSDVREAIRQGVDDYLALTDRASPEVALDHLLAAIDSRVKQTISHGVFNILSDIELHFAITSIGDIQNQNLLQREAAAQGIYLRNYVNRWILLAYLEYVSGSRLNVTALIAYIQSREAHRAPPATLKVAGCPEDIAYTWPTTSLPDSTFREVRDVGDGEEVHWGVCRPTRTLWVYHYQRGWRQTESDEQGRACARFSDVAAISEACRRERKVD